MTARVGALAKSAGQPYAGNPHVRLEEGAPVGTPCEDIQALPTERGSSSYGLATARPDRALLYSQRWGNTHRTPSRAAVAGSNRVADEGGHHRKSA